MVEPTTSNVALIVPLTGDLVGSWGSAAINPDMVALDGLLGGVANVGLTNVDVTLTAPSGAITPAAGPNQAQNSVLRFTGTLTGNVTVTLPLPGPLVVENMTTGNFLVTFRAVGSGEVICTPQGSCMRIYNDGTNVRFVNDISVRPGKLEFEGGEIGLPAWMAGCTVKPYLVADGTVYPVATYPYLAAKYGSKFGGDGVTTFGVPDEGGRVPLAYDQTGTRITTAGCGINGQTIGAVGGEQTHVLTTSEIPAHTHTATVNDPQHAHTFVIAGGSGGGNTAGGFVTPTGPIQTTAPASTGIGVSNANTGGGGAHNNVQPAQVTGVWLVKT